MRSATYYENGESLNPTKHEKLTTNRWQPCVRKTRLLNFHSAAYTAELRKAEIPESTAIQNMSHTLFPTSQKRKAICGAIANLLARHSVH